MASRADVYSGTDAYWTGRFSVTVGEAAKAIGEKDPNWARKELRSALAEFIASPVPCEELRETLRGYLK